MLFGASSGTLYSINTGPFEYPFVASLLVVPGTAVVSPFANLNANGWVAEIPLTSK
jgi:hypothetical protein